MIETMLAWDFLPTNLLCGLYLQLSDKWVHTTSNQRSLEILEDTEYAKKTQRNVYSVYKHVETGEKREIRRISYAPEWTLKPGKR